MKKVKGFVQQREKPEGSMAEGYISYESFYYASEYNKQIDNRPVCSDLGRWKGWRQKRRGVAPNEWKKSLDKE